MKKINLLVILPSYSAGGAEKVILNYLQAIKSNFIKPSLVVINSQGPLKIKIKNCYTYNYNYYRFIFSIPSLIKFLFRSKPDVVISTFPHISIFLLIIKKLKLVNYSLIIRQPNMISISLSQNIKLKIIKFIYKKLILTCDKLVVTSSAMQKEALGFGVSKDKINIIRSPIDISLIRKNLIAKRVKGEGLRLIFVGRLVYQKGIERLLNILKNNSKNIHLLILGEGPEKRFLKNIVKEYNLMGKVSFMGYLKKPNSFIAGSDFLMLPSRWEGLPNIVLESLALGTPVIAFRDTVSLTDYKKSIAKKNIILCEDEVNMSYVIGNLKRRKDYKNPKIRSSILELNNTKNRYQKNINQLVKEIFVEK